MTKKTESQVLINQLKRQLETPIAILVLGGNDEAAERVVAELKRKLNNIKNGNMLEVCDFADVGGIAYDTFKGERKRLFVRLTRGSSTNRTLRNRVMGRVRDIGAQSVVALWVKGNSESNNQNAQAVDEALRTEPPTIEDGFDRIYTWEE